MQITMYNIAKRGFSYNLGHSTAAQVRAANIHAELQILSLLYLEVVPFAQCVAG